MGTVSTLSWCSTMADIPRMNDDQLREARKLIQKRCCNYDNGNCVMMDHEYCSVCAQWITYTLNCRWFRNAVLPSDPELEGKILKRTARKKCSVCGKPIFSKSNRAKYCPVCAKKIRKQKEAIRLHNYYLYSRI